MKPRIVFVVAVLALASPVLAGVYVDYDRAADLDSYKTFAWFDKPGTSLEYHNSLLHSRVKNYIEHLLTQGKMVEAQPGEEPDLKVTYHASSETEMSLDTAAYGYTWGVAWVWDPYWGGGYGWGPPGTAGISTTVRNYDVGTLIIDIIDASNNQLVWRGTATGIMVPDNPQKLEKKIYKNIDKMVKKWKGMRPGD